VNSPLTDDGWNDAMQTNHEPDYLEDVRKVEEAIEQWLRRAGSEYVSGSGGDTTTDLAEHIVDMLTRAR